MGKVKCVMGALGTWSAKPKHWMGPISRESSGQQGLSPALPVLVRGRGLCLPGWCSALRENRRDGLETLSPACCCPSDVSENTKERALLGNGMKTAGMLGSSSGRGCLSNWAALSCPPVPPQLCQGALEGGVILHLLFLQSFLLSKRENLAFALQPGGFCLPHAP